MLVRTTQRRHEESLVATAAAGSVRLSMLLLPVPDGLKTMLRSAQNLVVAVANWQAALASSCKPSWPCCRVAAHLSSAEMQGPRDPTQSMIELGFLQNS